MDNMYIFNKVKTTPKTAQKTIEGGRLSGYTDINPMWRIKKLTELFGPCGVGWKIEIINRQIVDGSVHYYEKGKGESYRIEECTEKCVFVDILLLYKKEDNQWSEGVFGTGGANYVTAEKYAPYVDNDCWKKALTDAIGNACKNLGMSADIYFSKDEDTKHETTDDSEDFFRAVTKKEEDYIKGIAREKWGKDTPNKIQPSLVKYNAKMVKEIKKIDMDKLIEDIKNAD